MFRLEATTDLIWVQLIQVNGGKCGERTKMTTDVSSFPVQLAIITSSSIVAAGRSPVEEAGPMSWLQKKQQWFTGTNVAFVCRLWPHLTTDLWWLCYIQKSSRIKRHNSQRACTLLMYYFNLCSSMFLRGQALLLFTLMLSDFHLPSNYSVVHGFGEEFTREPVWRSSIPVLQVDHIFLHP